MAVPVFEDAVRPYQLPQTSPAQLYLSQFNQANNQPIIVTPGFGSTGAGPLPPIQTGSSHFDETITYYMDQASVEQREA